MSAGSDKDKGSGALTPRDAAVAELLPCPFCGGRPTVSRGSWNIGSVDCAACNFGFTCDPIAEAKRQWNKRAPGPRDETPAEVIEALGTVVEFLAVEYADAKSQALDGHPIAREARDVWEKVSAAIALTQPPAKAGEAKQ